MEISVEKYVDDFFRRCGLGSPMKPDFFWRTLSKNFGRTADVFVGCVESRERGEDVNPYPLKNQSLEFANAIASQFDAAKLKAVAVWFIKDRPDIEGKRVLELGCDNGILLCLFAELYPDTKFIGVDICSEAIEIAKQRAVTLELGNVEFFCGAVKDHPSLNEHLYEIILSITVFHEVLADDSNGSILKKIENSKTLFSIEDLDEQLSAQYPLIEELDTIKKLLSPIGRFISADRWGFSDVLLMWVRLAEKAGLYLSLPSSRIICYKDPGVGTQNLPLTVFACKNKIAVRASDILSFFAYPHFVEKTELHVIKDHILAELIYSALNKIDVYYHEVTYNDGSGIAHLHIGVANGIGFMYTATNTKFRELALVPSALLYERIVGVNKTREHLWSIAKVTHRWGDPKLLSQLGIFL